MPPSLNRISKASLALAALLLLILIVAPIALCMKAKRDIRTTGRFASNAPFHFQGLEFSQEDGIRLSFIPADPYDRSNYTHITWSPIPGSAIKGYGTPIPDDIDIQFPL